MTPKADFKGFALSNLTSEVKAKIKKDKSSADDVLSWIEEQASNGYKVAVIQSHDDGVFMASLFALYRTTPNAGLMLSIRHVDMLTALRGLMVVHSDVYDGEWMTKQDFDW